jgi:hypothetical protein
LLRALQIGQGQPSRIEYGLMEPFRLRRWYRHSPSGEKQIIFTCARPGRSKGSSDKVPDNVVEKWVAGLPATKDIADVSLLGHKPDGTSEFAFYSFGSAMAPDGRAGRVSLQNWLDRRYKNKNIKILEKPTEDFSLIGEETLNLIAGDVAAYLSKGWTVVVMDSGGETRTGQVCRHMGFREDTTSPVRQRSR